MPDEIARLIELENGRRRQAAYRGGRFRRGVQFCGFELVGLMNNPNMVLGIHRYADCPTHDPMVRQRLRPHRIHLKSWRLDSGSLYSGLLPDYGRSKPERAKEGEKAQP